MRLQVAAFAGAMLVFGTVNTIATKWQDITVVGHTASGRPRVFSHPAFQSACMFLGELLCLVPYLATCLRAKPRRPAGEAPRFRHESWGHKARAALAFALPALCDSAATTLLNVGLLLTYASVFQMLRGTMVIFTGLLTVLLLRRRLHSHHWLGILLITCGAAIVGASSVIYKGHAPHHAPNTGEPQRAVAGLRSLLMLEGGKRGAPDAASAPLLGDLLIVAAQVVQATQFIIEEKFLTQYRVPALLAVGLEGFWGLAICAVALPVLSRVRGADGLPLDSFPRAVREIAGSRALQWSTLGTISSIAFFNFFGISVTKRLSGAGRATIDACRTVFVWGFSLYLGWERFHGLQVLGFLVIVCGSSLYNELIRSCLPKHPAAQEADAEAALEEPLLGGEGGGSSLPPLPPGARGARARPIQQPSPYSLARSLRAAPRFLSPHSLASPARGEAAALGAVAEDG